MIILKNYFDQKIVSVCKLYIYMSTFPQFSKTISKGGKSSEKFTCKPHDFSFKFGLWNLIAISEAD